MDVVVLGLTNDFLLCAHFFQTYFDEGNVKVSNIIHWREEMQQFLHVYKP
jgi:hypothetical protein